MAEESIPERLLRESFGVWRGFAPLAEPYTRSMVELADLFGFTPSAILGEIVSSARSRLVGRPVEFDVGTDTLSLLLRDITLESDPIGPAIGQLGDLEVVAGDLRWRGVTVDHLVARLRNVHIQPGSTPVVVAAPVEFELTVSAEQVSALAASTSIGQKVSIELGDDVASVHPLKGRSLGHVDVHFEPAPRHVNLVLRQVHAGERWKIGRGLGALPQLRFALPAVLHNRVHAVDVEDGRIVLRGHVAEWREPIGPTQLQQLAERLGAYDGGILEVPRSDADTLDGVVDRARAAELDAQDAAERKETVEDPSE